MEGRYEKVVLPTGLIIALFVVAVALFINAGKACDSYIDFIVVGDYTDLNGTIPEIQYGCLEKCIDVFSNDYPKLDLCFDSCREVGDINSIKFYDNTNNLCNEWLMNQQNISKEAFE